MLVFLALDCVAKWARSAATNPFCALSRTKNPAHKSWKLLKNHSLVNAEDGIGKTTFAAEYYRQQIDHCKHLVWLYTDTGIPSEIE
jgi:hypothetical protein